MELTQKYMEKKFVKVPFDLEMAKKITSGDIEGRIVTDDGRNARIVDWNYKTTSNEPILAIISDRQSSYENTYSFNDKGIDKINDNNGISPLMLEVPEYLTFKDGDVLSNGKGFVFILNTHGEYKTSLYVCLHIDKGPLSFGGAADGNNIKKFTFASEVEKQKLIDALKASKEPEAKPCLKILGIEEKPKYDFKPKDWVLVRNYDLSEWWLARFSHVKYDSVGKRYVYGCTSGSYYRDCIPYNDQTKHLLGTTDKREGDN